MTTTESDLNYPGPYQLVQPDSELDVRLLEKMIRADLPREWQGHAVYMRSHQGDGRFGLLVSPSTTSSDHPMEVDLTQYEGSVYALQRPSGKIETGWTLNVNDQNQSNLLPNEPVL